jgi:DNA-binding NarL/FixJ family response regulator
MSAKVSSPFSTKTFLISNNQLLFAGLQATLSHVTTTTMAHGSGNPRAEEVVQQAKPQVIILDMESHQNITELLHKLKGAVPHAKILLLAGLNDMERTREAFISGVDGIVLNVQPREVLLVALLSLIQPPSGPDTVAVNGCSGPKCHIAAWPASLTQRERDIVRLVSQGLSNKEIAGHLCISAITARHHLTSIFDKLGVSGRQQLLIHAHQEGLVPPTAVDAT